MTLLTSESELKQSIFNENDPRLHVIDLFSQWCGPCQQMVTIFKSLTLTIDFFDDRVNIVQVDRELNKDFAAKYPATSKPLFLFYKQGALQKTLEGCNSPEILRTIDALIPPVKEDD